MPTDIQRFDFTLKADEYRPDQIIDVLQEWCNKWVFQREIGETGYNHYQGRFNLFKAKHIPTAQKLWSSLLPGIHISPTSNACKTWSYVMKADTREEGPWSDDQPINRMTPQLDEFLTHKLYSWQEDVEAICKENDFRKITVILDDIGNTGKSIFAEYLEYKGLAYEIPPFTCMEDLMQCAMGIKPQKCYLVDMPRGMKKEKLHSFYCGLEALKNGVMYDKRYAFKKRRVARPQVIVFTNAMPDVRLLSIDRWKILRMTGSLSLIEADIELELSKKGLGGASL